MNRSHTQRHLLRSRTARPPITYRRARKLNVRSYVDHLVSSESSIDERLHPDRKDLSSRWQEASPKESHVALPYSLP